MAPFLGCSLALGISHRSSPEVLTQELVFSLSFQCQWGLPPIECSSLELSREKSHHFFQGGNKQYPSLAKDVSEQGMCAIPPLPHLYF